MKLTATALLFAGFAFAQAPPTVANMYASQLKTIESEIVPLVEAMPENKINFAPSQGEFKGVRTFAEQAKHVAAVNYMVAAAAKGEKVPVDIGKDEKGPDSVKTRAEIAKFLKDSYAYARGVAQTLTAENAMQP